MMREGRDSRSEAARRAMLERLHNFIESLRYRFSLSGTLNPVAQLN